MRQFGIFMGNCRCFENRLFGLQLISRVLDNPFMHRRAFLLTP